MLHMNHAAATGYAGNTNISHVLCEYLTSSITPVRHYDPAVNKHIRGNNMHSDNVIEFRRKLDQDNNLHNEVMQIQTDNGCVAVTEIVRLAEKYNCPVSIDDFVVENEIASAQELQAANDDLDWPCIIHPEENAKLAFIMCKDFLGAN